MVDQMQDKQLSARLQLDLKIDNLLLKDLVNLSVQGDMAAITLSDLTLMQLLNQDSRESWQAGLKRLDIRTTGIALGDIAKKDVSLDTLTLDIQEVAVDQPAGFGKDKLASLEGLAIATEKLDLKASEHVIGEILIKRPAASIYVKKASASNVQALLHSVFGPKKESIDKHDASAKKEDTTESKPELPVIRIAHIKIEDGDFNLRDESLTEEALVFPLKNIQFETSQLRLFETDAIVEPTPVSVSFELEQPGALPTAYFGGLAHIGSVGVGVPLVNSQVRLTGLKLETFGALIPPTTDVTLGASGFDAEISIVLDTDSILMHGSGTSDKNVQYEGIKVRGPLDAPEIKMGVLLAGAYSRVSDGLVNLGLKGLGAGFDIVEGGLDIAKAVGKGTLEVGKNIGESVLEVGTGVATLDQQKLKEGIKGTTIDTAKLTSDTVKDSGAAAGDSLKESASEMKGHSQLQAWDASIPERFQTAMQAAQEDLAKMPFPPSLD